MQVLCIRPISISLSVMFCLSVTEAVKTSSSAARGQASRRITGKVNYPPILWEKLYLKEN